MYMCVGMFQCGSWKENDEIHEKKDDSVPLEYLFLHVMYAPVADAGKIQSWQKISAQTFQGTNK